jgi:transcriptional regulator with XRE-family HTH domain
MGTRRVELGTVGEIVRQRVRAARISSDLRLEDLAERLKNDGHPLSKATLSQIETGGRRVDVDDLVALADALEISPGDLLGIAPAGPRSASQREIHRLRREQADHALKRESVRRALSDLTPRERQLIREAVRETMREESAQKTDG